MKYECFAHVKTRLRYHIIFSTKYRRKCLNNIHDDVINVMKQAENCEKAKFHIEIMELDKDHIHFLIKIDPSECISNVVHYLKQFSTYYLWKTHYDHLHKFYWSGKHELWTRGYFVSTIGNVSENTLKAYIENQG